MASTYTTRIGLEKQADGENANTWGLRLNTNVIDLVDEATAGYESIDISGGATTLTDTVGVSNQARNMGLRLTGALSADTTVTIPAEEKIYFVTNDTTEDFNVLIKPAGGTLVTATEQGQSMMIATDGSIIKKLETGVGGTINAINVVATSLVASKNMKVSATLSAVTVDASNIISTNITNSGVVSATTFRGTSATLAFLKVINFMSATRIEAVSADFGTVSATSAYIRTIYATSVGAAGNEGQLDIRYEDFAAGLTAPVVALYNGAEDSTSNKSKLTFDFNNQLNQRHGYGSIFVESVDTQNGFEDAQMSFKYLRSGVTTTWLAIVSSKATLTGDLHVTGTITEGSDERFKSNIQTLDGTKAFEMRGVSFEKDSGVDSGVIAQELELIAPELVKTNSEGYKSVAYSHVIGYLIEAVKHLKEEVETLKGNN